MTAKQAKALSALLNNPTQERAAAAAGIGISTLKRYLADPDFQAEYQKAMSKLIEGAATQAKSAITAIEDSLKAEMLAKNTDVLSGKDYTITWKTIITNRFDSAAFRLTHADLFAQFSRSSTSRRFVIA